MLYDTLYNSSYQGVSGILGIDSQKPGPIVVVGCCTHPGEQVGRKIIQYLLDKFDLHNRVKKGKLIFTINNYEGYKNFLDGLTDVLIEDEKSMMAHILSHRYKDENMNRCCNEKNLETSSAYEVQRANDLKPILSQADYFLDLHTVYSAEAGSKSMLIPTENAQSMTNVFNVDQIFNSLVGVCHGKPLIDITERGGGIGIGLEAGYELGNGFDSGLENTLRLLIHLDCIDLNQNERRKYLTSQKNMELYTVFDSVIIEDNFIPVRKFDHGECISAGTVVAVSNGKDIVAPKDCYTLLCMGGPEINFSQFIGQEFVCFANKV